MSALVFRPKPEPVALVPVSDAELARRVASPAGDAAAEAELCDRLRPRLRLYGLRHLRDAGAADDLAHDVVLLVLERLRSGRVRDPERLASFALGACRLLVRNQRRGQARRRALLDRHPWPATAAGHGDTTLDAPRVRRCLQALELRQQTVLVLTFYAEHSAAEIAGALALTPENVRAIRHRALARLRECVTGASR